MAKRPVKKPSAPARPAVKKKPVAAPPAKAPPPAAPPSVAATAATAAAIAPAVAAAIAPIVVPAIAPAIAPIVAATVAKVAETAPVSPPPAEKTESAEPPVMSPLPSRLVELFRLSRLEQRAVYQLFVSDAPMSVATLADRLELELVATIALLAPEGTLRGRALVEAEARAGLGFLAPCDLVTVGRGLHLWCGESDKPPVDDALLFASHAPGVTYFAAPLPGTSWAQDLIGDKRPPAVAEVVRDHLGAGHAVALWLSSASQNDLMPLVQALRARLARPVVLIESAQVAGWPQPELCAALRRLRRDADLRGAAVVVSDVKQLGGAYRALCQPRPVGQTAPVILCGSDDKPPVGKLPQGASFDTPLAPALASLTRVAPSPAATTAIDDTTEDPALLASREEARRRAAYDAARAMGRPLPPELSEPAKAAATTTVSATAAVARPVPASPIYKPPPPASYTPPPPPEEEPPPAAAARPVNPRLAAALAKAGLPPAGSASYHSEQFTPRPTPPAPVAPPPEPAAAAPPASAPAVAPAAEAAPAPEAPAEPMPEDDQPPLPVEENASLDEILRIIRTTPNNAQRVQMLRELAGKRAPTVIQLFRSFITSSHPGVRAAAEAGMASIFGASWNRTRAIAAPIQPPRSDDGGRGPGGAF